MTILKKISTSLLIAPILFMGCTAEKVASLKAEKPAKKILISDKNQTTTSPTLSKEKKLLAEAIFGGEISLKETQNSIVISSNRNLTTQTLNFNESWEEFTKEDEILETAKEFLGVQYIWAANGPSAFDCSGFTKYVFKENGIVLPRYSGNQANVGKKIRFSQLKKGDLVFFDTSKKFKKHVNHVGIYIGRNKFIHASSAKKKVVITSFSKRKFYKNKFLYARRVVNINKSFALNTSTTKKDSLIN